MELFSPPLLKYVRIAGDKIIIFPMTIQHTEFRQLHPITAGLCSIDAEKKRVICSGASLTLNLPSDEETDSNLATLQLFGTEVKVGN